MSTKQRLLTLLLIACGSITPTVAQNRTNFAGIRRAIDYAYGITVPGIGGPTIVSPAAAPIPPLFVDIGTTTTGSGSLVLAYGTITAGDGTQLMPLSTNAPITVGGPTNQETVTPSGVSCSTPNQYSTCVVTATFAKVHGRGEPVTTGTFGLQEALNIESVGGGDVGVDPFWQSAGGTTAMLQAAVVPQSFVDIIDTRQSAATFYWTPQPSTLTLLATPTTLTTSTAVFSGTTGTWTNAAQFICVTYVDILGGEGPCSATFNQTPAANTVLTITSPAASTGAVGYRVYAGASYAASYLLPITTATCTLSTGEYLVPACAIGANATFPSIFTTTTTLIPAPVPPVAASNSPVTQGHTTFVFVQSAASPQAFQTSFGPFAKITGGSTAGQVEVLGAFNLPVGYLNYIGRTIRLTGKAVVTTAATTTTPSILVELGWAGGTTAGAPVQVCAATTTSALGVAATYNISFTATLTTNAVGATAIGTIQTNCNANFAVQGGTTAAVVMPDTSTAVVGSLGLFSQDTVYVYFIGATSTTSASQLMSLNVETVL